MKNDGKRRTKIKKPYDSFLANSLKVPMDVITGEIKMTLVGNGQLLVENYQGLVKCEEGKIVFQGKLIRVSVEGEALRMEYYASRETLLCGRIRGIRFEETERGS